MGLDKRKRCVIGLGVIALGALVADRVLVLPGPSSASAAAIASDADNGEAVDLGQVKALASDLAHVCGTEAPARAAAAGPLSSLDPFESPWTAVEDVSSKPQGSTQAVSDAPAGPVLPELSGVVSVRGHGYAILDGKPLSVGGSRDGYTLTELTDQTATISIRGAIYTLSLRKNNSSP